MSASSENHGFASMRTFMKSAIPPILALYRPTTKEMVSGPANMNGQPSVGTRRLLVSDRRAHCLPQDFECCLARWKKYQPRYQTFALVTIAYDLPLTSVQTPDNYSVTRTMLLRHQRNRPLRRHNCADYPLPCTGRYQFRDALSLGLCGMRMEDYAGALKYLQNVDTMHASIKAESVHTNVLFHADWNTV